MKGNSNGTWKIINSLITHKKSNSQEDIEFKDENGKPFDQKEVAEKT